VAPPVQERVVVREYYPVYVPPPPVYVPPPPTYYAPVYYAPAYSHTRVIVRERGWVPPGHAKKWHRGYHDRD